MTTICIFGDSMTQGKVDTELGGWVNLLKIYFENSNSDIKIYNYGVPGYTTSDLLRSFYRLCKTKNPDTIIFAIGINDSKCIGKNSQCVVPLATTEKNLEELIKQAMKLTRSIIFLGLTNINESKSMPVFWNGKNTNIFFTQANINLYNDKIKKLAKKNNLFFIDMLNVLTNKDLKDGLHPNYEGHKKIFKKVSNLFMRNKLV